jgi:SAM-dependent methyltransferase
MNKRNRTPEEETLRQKYIKIAMSIVYGLMIVVPIITWLFLYEKVESSNKVNFYSALFTAFIVNGFIGLISIWVLSKEKDNALDASIKRVRTAFLNEHFVTEEIPDSLKHGFEYCNNRVETLRVYAVSTTHIVAAVEMMSGIHINNCRLMVRGYGENMSIREVNSDDEIERNIARWENLRCLYDFEYIRYNNYPLNYYCIFDNRFISFGQYIFEEEKKDPHKAKFLPPFSITNQTEVGQQIINNFIVQFDGYFNSEKKKNINFNEIAGRYDNLRVADNELIKSIIEGSSINRNAKILDYGCGTGNYIAEFQKLGFDDIFGLDISKKMREIANTKTHATIYKNFNEVHEVFDFIFIIDVIHLIKDINSLVKKLYSICNNGAKIAIVTQSHEQIKKRRYKDFFPSTIKIDLHRYPDIDILIRSFNDVGFNLQKKEIFKENSIRMLDFAFLNKVKKKCFSMFELIHEDEFNSGIKKFEDALQKAEGNVIKETYAGKTILFFSKTSK